MKKEPIVIAVDVDSTIFFGKAYPDIGEPIPGAIEGLKYLHDKGVKLILHTMRCDGKLTGGKDTITPVVDFLKKNGIEIWAININPDQVNWTGSRKTYSHMCIDDINCGCPLIKTKDGWYYCDWVRIMQIVRERFDL